MQIQISHMSSTKNAKLLDEYPQACLFLNPGAAFFDENLYCHMKKNYM
jgi:hypothetical protein